VELRFKLAPKDLMKKFVDTLLLLPNLRRLELLNVSHRSPVTVALKRKRTIFPNIREMVVDEYYPDFIQSCPNLESLTTRHGFSYNTSRAIRLYGAGLKRVTGVDFREDALMFGKFTAHRLPDRRLTWSSLSYHSFSRELSEASGDRSHR
jgi:hypothetical protein